MLAPTHVSAPAVTQTSNIPVMLGSARLTSEGGTKIDAPTIVPTTIAVACVRPIERESCAIWSDVERAERRGRSGSRQLGRAEWMLSPKRRRQLHACGLHENPSHGLDGIGVARRLVRAIAIVPGEAGR